MSRDASPPSQFGLKFGLIGCAVLIIGAYILGFNGGRDVHCPPPAPAKTAQR